MSVLLERKKKPNKLPFAQYETDMHFHATVHLMEPPPQLISS